MAALQAVPFPQHGRGLRRLGTIGLMLLSGCAGSPDRPAAVRTAHEVGDPALVESLAMAAEAERPGDGVLWKLERGLALRRLGRLQESIRALEEAEEALRAEEERPGFSAVGSVSALLVNDLSRPYAAKPVDRIYASAYQALNRLEAGDRSGARVSLNRLRFIQEAFGDSAIYLPPTKDAEAERLLRDPGTAEALRRIDAELEPVLRDGTYDDAFAHWLQGMFFSRLGLDAADREKGRKALAAALRLSPDCEVMKRDLADAEAGRFPARTVYFVAETGLCPQWYEERVDIPVFIVSRDVPLVSVALPALRPAGQLFGPEASVDGRPLAFTRASSTEGLIASHFSKSMPAVRSRALLSAASKAAASYAINRASRISADRADAGTAEIAWAVATRLGTTLYGHSSTRADLRNWSGLPARTFLARTESPVGAPIAVKGLTGAPLRLPAGKVLLVSISCQTENSAPSVRCTILSP